MPEPSSIGPPFAPRGLHGEGDRGHVFWDELFVLPLLTQHLPWVSRALLDYRHWRLERAAPRQPPSRPGRCSPRKAAATAGRKPPTQLYNPRSGRWMPDNSRRQRPPGLAIAYNAWQYYQATGHLAWLAHKGADLIIEVALAL